MINYRKATIDDAEILTAMRVRMLSEGEDYPPDFIGRIENRTREYIISGLQDNSYIIWVAEAEEQIAAMGGITIYYLPPNDWCISGKSAYLGSLYTDHKYRKLGIASELLNRLVEEAKGIGCERILLHTTKMGRAIYERFGFENSEGAMAYYPFGVERTAHFTNE